MFYAYRALAPLCALLLLPALSLAGPRCLTPIVAEAWQGGQIPAELGVALTTAKSAGSRILFPSPGGNFELDYAASGPDSVDAADLDTSGTPDYVEHMAEALDQSWAGIVNDLGFTPPALLPGQRIEVRLRNLNNNFPGTYGYTQPDPGAPTGAYLVLHADFAEFLRRWNLPNQDPQGDIRGAIRVTAAHELEHIFQLAASGWTENPRNWLELDATWVEDLVFDQVNDYYNYLDDSGSPFSAPAVSLVSASYEDATFQHFISERHGMAMMRDFWNRRALRRGSESPQSSMEEVAIARGVDWVELWGEYAAWTYATESRSAVGVGFGEAADYPLALRRPNVASLPWEVETGRRIQAMGMDFHELSTGGLSGELVVGFEAAVGEEWALTLVFQGSAGVQFRPVSWDRTSGGYQEIRISGMLLEDFDRVGLVVGMARVLGSAGPSFEYRATLDVDEPQVISKLSLIAAASPGPGPFPILWSLARASNARMVIYDLRGRQRRLLLPSEARSSGEQAQFSWDGRDDGGNRLPSGSYILRLDAGSGSTQQRISIVR